MASSTANREIVVTHEFEAPRELVFEAFTEREHTEQWWVPNGTTHEWNAEPGGMWRYSQPAGGKEYTFQIRFIEIDKPERLVYDFVTETDDNAEPVRTTVTFDEQDGKTMVTLQLVYATAAERQKSVKYGAIVGAMQSLENLADYLGKL